MPETRNSPFTGWNAMGNFNRYDRWDTFATLEDQSASGWLSPVRLSTNMLIDASYLTLTTFDAAPYPNLDTAVFGLFQLPHLDGGGPSLGCNDDCVGPFAAVRGPLERDSGFALGARDS